MHDVGFWLLYGLGAILLLLALFTLFSLWTRRRRRVGDAPDDSGAAPATRPEDGRRDLRG